MRALIQRVARASVRVEERTVGAIEAGLLVLAAIRKGDTEEDAEWLAGKITALRIFPDENGKMNRSVVDSGGDVLLVSQFTLYGDVRKGRRPSFEASARPDEAIPRLDDLKRRIESAGPRVETGEFGAHMEVELLNDGPVTLMLDSEVRKRRGTSEVISPAPVREAPPGGVPLVLASQSPRRHELLRNLGLSFSASSPGVDESADLPSDPDEQARVLAERKARAVASSHADAIVLAADTIVVLDGRPFGKPVNAADAKRMLGELSGREHRVVTGVCAAHAAGGTFLTRSVTTRVRFRELEAGERERYVASGEPFGKAGAYAIQGIGGALVASIDGDYTNVIGLPVAETLALLEEAQRLALRVRETGS